jgi:hypothetical protein
MALVKNNNEIAKQVNIAQKALQKALSLYNKSDDRYRNEHPSLDEIARNAMQMLFRMGQGLDGATEYPEVYQGDETLERYHHAVTGGWNQTEDTSETPAITQEEIKNYDESRTRRQHQLDMRREKQMRLEHEARKAITGEYGMEDEEEASAYAAGKKKRTKTSIQKVAYVPIYGDKAVMRKVHSIAHRTDMDDPHAHHMSILHGGSDDDEGPSVGSAAFSKNMEAVMDKRRQRHVNERIRATSKQTPQAIHDDDDDDDDEDPVAKFASWKSKKAKAGKKNTSKNNQPVGHSEDEMLAHMMEHLDK